MADKFECDQCGELFGMTEKAGRLILERIQWNGGIQFPPLKLYQHDLCRGCMSMFEAPRLKRPKKHAAPAQATVVEKARPMLEEPKPPVIDIRAEPEKEG